MVIIVYRVFLVLTIRIAAFGNEIGRRIARFLPDGRAVLLMTSVFGLLFLLKPLENYLHFDDK